MHSWSRIAVSLHIFSTSGACQKQNQDLENFLEAFMALILNILFKSLKFAYLKYLAEVQAPEQKWVLGNESMT